MSLITTYFLFFSHIFRSLPINKQVIAASATYTPELKKFLEDYMRSPIRVNPQQTNVSGRAMQKLKANLNISSIG
jgi:superfamily II DNA/RNA helicase